MYTMTSCEYTTQLDVSPGLRRRSTGVMSFDDEESFSPRETGSTMKGYSSMPFRYHPPLTRPSTESSTTSSNTTITATFALGRTLQLLIVLGICFMLYDRQSKVEEATNRLQRYKQEEAVLIGQMDSIEDRAAELRAKLKQLHEEHQRRQSQADNNNNEELTKEQTEKVKEEIMEWKKQYFQVNKDIHALEDFIQEGARKHIVDQVGEGSTVRISMDLGFPSPIIIDLFDEAPHASWVFLQQLQNGDWKDAAFDYHPAHKVSASRASQKPSSVMLEFVEKNFHHHEAWTVGMAKEGSGYNLYINLQENSHVHENDVCFAKVVSGHDSLRRLLEMETIARIPGDAKVYLNQPVVIKSFSVSSVQHTRRYV